MTREVGSAVAAFHPRLRAYVDNVWSPIGAKVSIGTAREAATATEAYLVLPNLADPRVLIADGPARRARAMMLSYRHLRGRAGGWQTVAAATALLGSDRLAGRLPRLIVEGGGTSLIAESLAAARTHVGTDLTAMLTLRDPSPVAKPTVSMFDESGAPRAYAKAGVNAITDAMVSTETRTLTELEAWLTTRGVGESPNSHAATFEVPGVLTSFTRDDHPVLITRPMPAQIRRDSRTPAQLSPVLAEIAASGEAGVLYWGDTDVAACVASLVAEVGEIDAEIAGRLGSVWERVSCRESEVAVGRSHGDWVRWNIGSIDGRVTVWDWESSRTRVPLGFDALHWWFQNAMAGSGPVAGVGAVRRQRGALGDLGVTHGEEDAVIDAYLVERLAEQVTKLGAVPPPLREAILSL